MKGVIKIFLIIVFIIFILSALFVFSVAFTAEVFPQDLNYYLELHPVINFLEQLLDLSESTCYGLSFGIPLLIIVLVYWIYSWSDSCSKEAVVSTRTLSVVAFALSIACLAICSYQILSFENSRELFKDNVRVFVEYCHNVSGKASLQESEIAMMRYYLNSDVISYPLKMVFRDILFPLVATYLITRYLLKHFQHILSCRKLLFVLLFFVPLSYSVCVLALCYPLTFIIYPLIFAILGALFTSDVVFFFRF